MFGLMSAVSVVSGFIVTVGERPAGSPFVTLGFSTDGEEDLGDIKPKEFQGALVTGVFQTCILPATVFSLSIVLKGQHRFSYLQEVIVDGAAYSLQEAPMRSFELSEYSATLDDRNTVWTILLPTMGIWQEGETHTVRLILGTNAMPPPISGLFMIDADGSAGGRLGYQRSDGTGACTPDVIEGQEIQIAAFMHTISPEDYYTFEFAASGPDVGTWGPESFELLIVQGLGSFSVAQTRSITLTVLGGDPLFTIYLPASSPYPWEKGETYSVTLQ